MSDKSMTQEEMVKDLHARMVRMECRMAAFMSFNGFPPGKKVRSTRTQVLFDFKDDFGRLCLYARDANVELCQVFDYMARNKHDSVHLYVAGHYRGEIVINTGVTTDE